jgi:hypothetical protein
MAFKQIHDSFLPQPNKIWASLGNMSLQKFNKLEGDIAMWMDWDLNLSGSMLEEFRYRLDMQGLSPDCTLQMSQFPAQLISSRLRDHHDTGGRYPERRW